MPRIKQFRNKYIAKDLRTWITEEMRIQRINQTEMGRYLNVNQQEMSKKLRGVDKMSADDLIAIFERLDVDAETVGNLMLGKGVKK